MPEPLRMSAEEADIEAGLKIFGNYFVDVVDCEISATREKIKLKNHIIDVSTTDKWRLEDCASFIRFVIYKLVISDRAMRKNLKFTYFMYLVRIRKKLLDSEFIAETSSMFAITSAVGGRVFTRSVNFESIRNYHVKQKY
jgi:hypothetical protein